MLDWKFMTEALAAETPWWEPGTQHGYHALTYGFLVGEVVRRIDGRTLGAYFRDELAEPLGLDFHIGFGPELDGRVAEMLPAPPTPPGVPNPFQAAAQNPESLVGKVFNNPAIGAGGVNTRGVARGRGARGERPRHGARARADLRRARARRRARRPAGAVARADRGGEHRAGLRPGRRALAAADPLRARLLHDPAADPVRAEPARVRPSWRGRLDRASPIPTRGSASRT